MSDPRPKELIHTEELLFIDKVEESLEIIRIYERKREISIRMKANVWNF